MSTKVDTPSPAPPPAPLSKAGGGVLTAATGRLGSLDAYRGAIMLLMASSGFGVPQVAEKFAGDPTWQFLGRQFDHATWSGCTLWDLIQPAFMFMVGVALPWSVANRRARGQRFVPMLGHALWRALLLVLLAVFLTSNWSKQTEWVFVNVLAQIGLGYPLLFLLAFAKPRVQWLAAGVILLAYWLAFALYPVAPAGFDWQAVGVPADWHHLTGLAAHWDKNANFAAGFDTWLLNLFPRDAAFTHSTGGYATLNFIPSLATMIFGLLAGQLLRSGLSMPAKLKRLVIAGLVGVALGKAIDLAGLCPIVKRIWTPSWAIYSGGLVTLMLAGFVTVIDWWRCKLWAFPLTVAGLNPITLYVMWQLMAGFVRQSLRVHLGQDIFDYFGPTYTPMTQRIAVLCVLWLVLLWMYRRRIFVRL